MILNIFIAKLQKYKENIIVRNSLYGAIQFFAPTLLLLIFTPIFIQRMGTTQYGLWMLATSTLGLMGIAEFGLGTTIAKFVAEFSSTNDNKALSTIISWGLISYVLLGAIFIVPLYVFSPRLATIFKPSETVSIEQIGDIVRIMSLGFIPLLLRNGAMSIPQGLQKFQTPFFFAIGYQVSSYVVALIVILLNGSIAQVVQSNVIILWITAIASLYVAWRMLHPYQITIAFEWSKNILQRMFSFSIMAGISSLGGQIFSFADRLAVGAILGLDAVAYYTIAINIASKILQLSGSVTSALMPAVSTWVASAKFHLVRAYFYKSTAILFILNLILSSILLFFSDIFFRVWLGEIVASQILVPFRFLVIIYALISLNAPAHHIAFGIGLPWLNAIASVTGGILTISLILQLGKSFGLLGAAIANAGYLSVYILLIYVFMYLRKHSQNEE